MPAPTTPVNRQPTDGEAGIRLTEPVRFQWDIFSGGSGTLREIRVRIWDSAGSTVQYDTGYRVPEVGVCGDGWWELFPRGAKGQAILLASTTYKWSVNVRDSAGSESSESTKTSFTMEAAAVSASTWESGQ